tara:strand:- start:354 stop:539 length:186 start_codon:yes stop_codon:yes gene_type:complete
MQEPPLQINKHFLELMMSLIAIFCKRINYFKKESFIMKKLTNATQLQIYQESLIQHNLNSS